MIDSVSASSIKDFRDCQRKWYTRKVLGIKSPTNSSANRGLRLHALFEAGQQGRIIHHPRVKIALAAVGPPIEGQLIEQKLLPGLKLAGVPVAGRHDIVRPGPVPKVIDLKSTKSFRYALNAESLVTDPQAVIYAWDTLERYGAPAVDLQWVYTKTVDRPAVKLVEAKFPLDRLNLAPLVATVEEMVKVSELPEHEVPQNPAACAKYGGCPYFSRCFPAKTEVKMATSLVRDDWDSLPVPTKLPLTLFVDVVAARVVRRPQEVSMDDYLRPLLEQVAVEAKVPDFRLVPFAGWRGRLAVLIKASPPSGNVFATRANEAHAVAIDVLAPMADVLYLGTR